MSPELTICARNYAKAVRTLIAEGKYGTQAEVAEKLDMLVATMSNIMSGKRGPTLEQAITLCSRFNISANWLLLGKGAMYAKEDNEVKELMRTLLKKLK